MQAVEPAHRGRCQRLLMHGIRSPKAIVLASVLSVIASVACDQGRDNAVGPPSVVSPLRLSTLGRAPIPTTLNESLDTLDRGSSGALFLKMRDGDESVSRELRVTLGPWIWHEWLRDRTPLYQKMETLGLKDPGGILDLILTCWWRRMHGQPLGIDEQVKAFQEELKRQLSAPRSPPRR